MTAAATLAPEATVAPAAPDAPHAPHASLGKPAAATTAPLMEIRDLSVVYATARGPLTALDRVNLSLAPAGITGVVGESGCGKSTLISAILGLLPANTQAVTGRIAFLGQDLVGLSRGQRRHLLGDRLSVVFQDPMTAFNPAHTIASHMVDIQHRAQLNRRAKLDLAAQMLDRVGIPEPQRRLAAYPHQLSGGMRQRVAIAMALMARPDLLIADEPTTALDATLEIEIVDLMRDLQREIGCAILFVSHHLGLIASFCDRVAVMYAGQVVEEGPVRAIFHHASHPYTRALLACDPAHEAAGGRVVPTIPGEIPDLVNTPPGCRFAPRCPAVMPVCAQTPLLTAAAGGAGHRAACHLLPGAGGL